VDAMIEESFEEIVWSTLQWYWGAAQSK